MKWILDNVGWKRLTLLVLSVLVLLGGSVSELVDRVQDDQGAPGAHIILRDADHYGATLIIAASDSKNKQAAHYVCDGVADNETIEAAMAALPSTGGSILCLDGTYTFGNTTDFSDDDITLVGQGYSTVFKMGASAINQNVLSGNGNDNLLISNLRVDGTKASQTSAGNGIKLTTCTNSIIQNVWVHDTYSNGIALLTGCGNITVSNAIVYDCGKSGVASGGMGIQVWNAAAGADTYNRIVNCTVTGSENQNIGIVNSHYCEVVNCHTYNSVTAQGIQFNGADYGLIQGCISEGNALENIDAYSSLYCTIDGNGAFYGSRQGIAVDTDSDYCLVTSNTCLRNGREGIKVYGSDYVTVDGNQVLENSYGSAGSYNGISVDAAAACTDTLITSNLCRDDQGTKTQEYGIAISNKSSVATVMGNQVSDNRTGGISDSGLSSIVRNNQGYSAGDSGAATFTVAASDSNNPGIADYVCDGTDDDVQIQAAIDELPSSGGLIYLMEGHFVGDTLALGNNTTLCGAGEPATTYTLMNGGNASIIRCVGLNDAETSFAGAVCYGINVRDLKLDGNSANQSDGYGINTTGMQRAVFERLYITDCKNSGIYANGTVKTTTGQTFRRVYSYANSGYGFECRNMWNTRIDTCHAQANGDDGIFWSTGGESIITNSVSIDNAGYGIYTSNGANQLVITDNPYIGENDEHGILCLQTSFCTISNNGIYRNGQLGVNDDGIVLNTSSGNNTITSNVIMDDGGTKTQDRAIRINSGCNYNVVTDNIVSNNKTAPYIVNSGTGNRIEGNTGYVTENWGTGSIDNGSTTDVFAHGLGAAPTHVDIDGTEDPTNTVGTWWWTADATNITISVENDPGASNWDFTWEAVVR